MLTPDTLAQLSPADRAARLELEGLRHYGTERFKAQLSRDFDLARSTVTTWKGKPELIPAGVILALAAWNELREAQAGLVQLDRLKSDLAQLAEQL